MTEPRRTIAYADPPYPGMAHIYKKHADYRGEVDHEHLIRRLCDNYDAWLLHTASTTLAEVLAIAVPELERIGREPRIGVWVKTFTPFRRGIKLAYAWEAIIFCPATRKRRIEEPTAVDWIACPCPLQDGLAGAKPSAVVHWALRCVNADRGDEIDDLYPGTGNVTAGIEAWRRQPDLADWSIPHGLQPLEGLVDA